MFTALMAMKTPFHPSSRAANNSRRGPGENRADSPSLTSGRGAPISEATTARGRADPGSASRVSSVLHRITEEFAMPIRASGSTADQRSVRDRRHSNRRTFIGSPLKNRRGAVSPPPSGPMTSGTPSPPMNTGNLNVPQVK